MKISLCKGSTVVSLWFMKSVIFVSKPSIDTEVIVQETVDSWLHATTYKSYNQDLTPISLGYTFHNPRYNGQS